MSPRRRFGKLFWFSLTIFTLIVIAIVVSARFAIGIAFPGGNISIGNGRAFVWRWGQPTFEPHNPFEKNLFDQFPPKVVLVFDSISLQFGKTRNLGLEGPVIWVATPMRSLKPGATQQVGVFLALWPFALVCLGPVGFGLLRWRREIASRGRNRCRKCDYDLTGNTSGRCPECGESI